MTISRIFHESAAFARNLFTRSDRMGNFMGQKIKDFGATPEGYHNYVFHCPGCGYSHPFAAGGPPGIHPQWEWNGSFDKPTFTPSLLCNQDDPKSRCHSFVTNGQIQFLPDCWHALKGQTVDLPDWDAALANRISAFKQNLE